MTSHTRRRWDLVSIFASVTLLLSAVMVGGASAGESPPATRTNDRPTPVHFDTSPPLTQMHASAGPDRGEEGEEEELELPPVAPGGSDGALQSSFGAAAAPPTIANFLGIGKGLCAGTRSCFAVTSAPPDTDGDVGPNHYFQIVNTSIAVFSKTGTVLYGPVVTKTVWAGFGGKCETRNDGDGIVKYDKAADRWIVTQFTAGTSPFFECVAVSTTGDPLGSYHRYAFQYAEFPDYPKVSVWSDGYYVTFNMYQGNSFLGAKVCAYDRDRMLIGTAATQQCFQLSSAFGGLLASDIDGATAPPAGSPNYVVNFGTNSLNFWKFHVDWVNGANSTFSGPTSIPVASFTMACPTDVFHCIPQKNTTQKLDSLSDVMMMRFAYRNFGDHESLVVNHAVIAGSSVGIRWYELRSPATTPVVFQQGTFAPDSHYRWMGSIAQDHVGNIGLGYSVSSTTLFPGIRYTGHLTTDPLGVMGQGEGVLIDGLGSQTGIERWGDYAALAVDPVDDCTFWFTSEYLTATGSFNWSTRIGSFKFPSCSGSQTPDFALSASPASQTVAPGGSTSYTTTITPSGGFADPVTLGVSGLPAGANGSFSPNPATTTSTLSVTTTGATPPGTYPLTITGTSGSLSHNTSVTLVVSGGGGGDFTISASPASKSVPRGGSTTYTVTITPTGGFSGAVTLSASGGQPGSIYSFSPNPTTSTSTLTVQTNPSGSAGLFTITISGTSGSLVHSTTVTISVTRA